mgnify:FL=1
MLSRHSVRIKVMQTLFALATDEDLSFDQAKKKYLEGIEKSYHLLLFNLYNILHITRVAVDDEANRLTKHLPTELDKRFSAKLYKNPIIQDLNANSMLRKQFESLHFPAIIDRDYCKKIYAKFSKTDEYKAYILDDHADHLDILLELFRFCRKEELFNELMEDHFICWPDDKSLVIGAIKKCLKSLPNDDPAFFKEYLPDHETVNEYGEVLLERTFEDNVLLMNMIKPLLKNWDYDRLALMDIILLKMAIIEMLEFKTIPTKVTLNEYVEVSKKYSTPKSKEFINGILDKILKDLTEEGKIVKEGRGLLD